MFLSINLDIATSTGKALMVENNNEAGIRSLVVQCQEEFTEGYGTPHCLEQFSSKIRHKIQI